jgi:uncharacterized protein
VGKKRYNHFMNSDQALSTPSRKMIRQVLGKLQTHLQQLYGDQAPQLLVYGSYARGDEDNTSDIDVLLLYSQAIKPGQEIQRLSSLLAELNIRYQVLISLLPIPEAEYHQSQNPFWQNVRHDGKPINAI